MVITMEGTTTNNGLVEWYAVLGENSFVAKHFNQLAAAVTYASERAQAEDRAFFIYEGDDPWPMDRIDPVIRVIPAAV
jgi:hypothetical protein